MIPNEVIMILLAVAAVLMFVVGYTMGYQKGNRYGVQRTKQFQRMAEDVKQPKQHFKKGKAGE